MTLEELNSLHAGVQAVLLAQQAQHLAMQGLEEELRAFRAELGADMRAVTVMLPELIDRAEARVDHLTTGELSTRQP